MKLIAIVLVICTATSIAWAKSQADKPGYRIAYSCGATQGGSIPEAVKRSPDFEVASLADGRHFIYSPSNRFPQESEPGKVRYNVAYLRAADIERDQNRLLSGLEVKLTPISKTRLEAYRNLPSNFDQNFEHAFDLSLASDRGVTYDVDGREYPFSNVVLAFSKDYNLALAFMSDNGSRYFLTHACK